ncbi:o-methylsterigmatocystin oxidoreductase [Colletotrichum incanum]|uniref:O-methylsterigmatocystin oxidoreductase n=1 Tax=Colletotrichum incanum TaxID=1573173 RepID=A0A167ELE0_COLIC|nr:o-methylsterigmatocystin oxidoreductase [Colletotrichum incanum]
MTAASWLVWSVFALPAFASQKKGQHKLPSGPKLLPLLNNIKDFLLMVLQSICTNSSTRVFMEASVTVMEMTLVIFHDKKVAHDLLDQAASKTSGRPSMVMANKLCGYEYIIICQGYSPMFHRYRQLLHQELGTRVSAAQFRDVQESEESRQLVGALREPGRWLEHYKTNAAATLLQMKYGYTVGSHKPDTLVELTEK